MGRPAASRTCRSNTPALVGRDVDSGIQQAFAGRHRHGPLPGGAVRLRIDQGQVEVVGRRLPPRLQLHGEPLAAAKHHAILFRRQADHAGRVPGGLQKEPPQVRKAGRPRPHEPHRVLARRQVEIEHLLGAVVRLPLAVGEGRVGQQPAVQEQISRPGARFDPQFVPAVVRNSKAVFRFAAAGQQVLCLISACWAGLKYRVARNSPAGTSIRRFAGEGHGGRQDRDPRDAECENQRTCPRHGDFSLVPLRSSARRNV